MVKDAEAHAAEDKAQREAVEARIRAEQEAWAKAKADDVREGEVVDA